MEPVSYTHLDVYKRQTVPPVSKRIEDILAKRIAAGKKPDIRDAQVAHRLAPLHFTNVAQMCIRDRIYVTLV